MVVSVLGVLLCVSLLDMVSGTCPEGTYGYDCRYQCHCPLDKCNPTSGCRLEDCDPGWFGLTCQKRNIALHKPTSASSVYDYGDPGNAVNGDNSASDQLECFQSDWNNVITQAWWRVDLDGMVRIHDVTIYFRTNYKVRRNGIQIYMADTAASPTDGVNCYNLTGNRDGTDIPDVLKVTCSGEGRYLVLYTTTVNNEPTFVTVPVMDFCEVEIDVCRFGYYSANCRKSCSNRNCKGDNSSCDYVTGMCVEGCTAGWNGTDCTQECLHMYGDGCSKMCSDRKCAEFSSDSCDHVTGRCEGGCRHGWKGTDCTEACILGVEYGANCEGNCSARMCEERADSCPQDTGRCGSECQTGWKGEDCTQAVTGSLDHEDRSISPLSAGLLGALAMLVSMAAVMGGVRLWRRKTHMKSSGNPTVSSPPPTTTASDYDVISGSQYATLDGRSPDMYESLNVSGVYSKSKIHI